ncbi:TIGR03986 family type III CRISPR-associated RAMP protein [Acanthopleuribacter pedis]|uniref:TIGR03986 family CRISPR-associated RAMP protein n=1 Tax=Acanthopleuribacter pedis TaxID=442870 RepID=A0A8J7QPX3_9BACT|nr:TIGR03986 family CRISPR-associated RAMP protein [Acanthopleuribacter pedis]MBO1321970.1 TIGR03986 family CRISPR-associated RAMP protein [Acanthopleuribacter pedis]
MTQRPKPVHAPYNFVPLSAFIYQPDWAPAVCRDRPFRDGLNGSLRLRLECHTPLLVGGRQEPVPGQAYSMVTPYLDHDGRPAIPGSSLKGMIRNLMRIASFGKMNEVDDRWLSIRDLTNAAADIYRRRMTNPNLTPKVKAGYLKPVVDGDGFAWELTPCQFLRVEHKDLLDLAERRGVPDPIELRDRQGAVAKYERWLPASLETTFSKRREPRQRSKQTTQEHEKAHDLDGGGISGRLVFTGQPNDARRNQRKTKHLEFVFYEPGKPLIVDERVMRAFLHIHGETEEWRFWEQRFDEYLGVPVFYLAEAGQPTEIGLTMMFRLAYRHSIGTALDHTHFGHRDPATRDLAALVFGDANEGDDGLAGRASFGTARLLGERRDLSPILTILNGPKPSYFPAYIDQDHNAEGLVSSYRTLMDEEAELRGWKRYPARSHIGGFEANSAGLGRDDGDKNDKVKTRLHPLAAGAVFEGQLRLHNLRPVELGALLWCLTWGGNPDLRHGLGMGKPFGLGSVSISVFSDEGALTRNDGGPVPDAETCIRLFTEEMERAYRAAVVENGKADEAVRARAGWAESEQLVQLIAMADPARAPGQPGSLRHMDLPQFLKARGPRKGDPCAALLPYAPFAGIADRDLFHRWTRKQWDDAEAARIAAAEHAKAEAERAAAEAAKSPLQRRLDADLAGPDAEQQATAWLTKAKALGPQEQVEVGQILRAFYQARDKKWFGKLSQKQKVKVAAVKALLSAEEGRDVPE